MRKFDYSKFENCLWDNEILRYLTQIHEHKGRQELFSRQKPVELEKLTEVAKVQSVESSNRIEGIITTSTRIGQIVKEKTTPKNRDEKEIAGYRDVLNTIHESHDYISITSNIILQLHRDLTKYSESGLGGTYKITQNYLKETRPDGSEFIRFTPVPPYETAPCIEAICENYKQATQSEKIDPLLLIPVFIHDFLCIHPFNDGNGRMSRLLTLLLLYRNGYEVGKYISIEKHIEKTKGAYYVADFHEDNFEKEAWFTKDGVWQMTETDLRCADLPAPVRSSYESSTYYNVWKVEDVDKLERKEMAVVYIIEVEKGNQEMDLYYSEDGILVKEVADAHNGGSPEDYLPSDISAAIKDFIAEKYPNARIVDIEKEKNGMTEVEIVHGSISKDVMFTAEGAWAYTIWDISKRHLEDVVKNAVTAAHPGYVIDDADFIETPDGSYFLVEMEQGEREIYVKVTAEGEILP